LTNENDTNRTTLIQLHHQDKPRDKVIFNPPQDEVVFDSNDYKELTLDDFKDLTFNHKNIHIPLNANTELVLNLKIQKKNN